MNKAFPLLGDRSLALVLLAGCSTAWAIPLPSAPLRPVLAGTAAAEGALDINTAPAAQLRALPGMGDAYVKRIIAGRPYTAKNQLVTRGILPRAAYEQIKDRIVAHRGSHL